VFLPVLAGWLTILLAGLGPFAAAQARVIDEILELPAVEMSPDDTGRWVEVTTPGGELAVQVGEPALPSQRVRVPLPAGLTVTAMRLDVLDEDVLQLSRPVAPYAGERSSLDDFPPQAEPDAVTYASADLFPAEEAHLVSVVTLPSGVHEAVVRVHSVRWRPAEGELRVIRRARVILECQEPERDEAAPFRDRSLLSAPAAATPLAPGGQVLLSERGLATTEMPSIEGSPVVYAIISPDDQGMRSQWQRLADWKTATGYPAQVFTLDWITENYSHGADVPESIRLFLRDAYQHWGLQWILIGADVRLIPARYARSWAYNSSLETGIDVATDYYYACLDGDWDADNDGIFGESNRWDNMGDDPDLVPELHVGRVSARDANEVRDFLEKYFIYAKNPPDDGYLDRGMMLGEVLFHKSWLRRGRPGGKPDCPGGSGCVEDTCRAQTEHRPDGQPYTSLVCATYDAADDCFEIEDVIIQEMGAAVELDFLLERSEYWAVTEPVHTSVIENWDNVMAALSDGTNFVHHVGHGDRDRWAIGDGRLLTSDLNQLTNGSQGHFYWVYGVNCSSAAIDYDCFGEHLVLLPGHGAVGYIGCTTVDFPKSALRLARDFYRYLYAAPGGTLGDGFFGSATANAPVNTNDEGVIRFLLYALVLLGDPGMMVWNGTPSDQLHVDFDAYPSVGAQTMLVTATVGDGGPAVAGARVCVHKEDDVYAVGLTGADGSAQIPCWTTSPGEFTVTVTSPHYYSVEIKGEVIEPTTSSALVVDSLQVVDSGEFDSAGNDNRRPEVGETVRWVLHLRNAGVGPAENVSVSLDPYAEYADLVEIVAGTATLGNVDAGQTIVDTESFLLTIASDPPAEVFGDADMLQVPIDVIVASSSQNATRTYELEVSRPRCLVATNEWDSVTPEGQEVYLGLTNAGKATASHLVAQVTANNEYVTVQNGEVSGFEILPGETKAVGPFQVLPNSIPLARLTFTVTDTFADPDLVLHTRVFDIQGPEPPDSLGVVGRPGAMILGWNEGEDPSGDDEVLGYQVYRSMEGEGQYEIAHGGILQEHRYMTDSGLEQLTEYSYRVYAIDAGGNIGSPSQVSSAYTAPGLADGWPNQLSGSSAGSPLICELDKVTSPWGGRNMREIIFGSARVYAFHGDGSEVTDGDGVASTTGPFSTAGGIFRGRAAAADLDGDDITDLVAVSGSDKTIYCWHPWGVTPKWQKQYTASIAWNSPTLADLDDNGKLEVIFIGGGSEHEGIYVLGHNGLPYKPGTDGKLIDMYDTYNYHPPSVGDIDGDEDLEIVATTRRGALYVVDGRTGEQLEAFQNGENPGQGFPLGERSRSSPVLANVDGVPGDEIFVVTYGSIRLIDMNGFTRWTRSFSEAFPGTTTWDVHPQPALGDLNRDGSLDIVIADAGGKLWAFRARDGVTLSGFPVDVGGGTGVRFGSPILANVDTDPHPDIVFGGHNGYIYAYDYEGNPARGFPLLFGGNISKKSVAAWDVDDDGYQNLVVQAEDVERLGVYHLDGVVFDPADNPWPMRHRDSAGTGRYLTDDAVGIAVTLHEPLVDADGGVHLSWTSAEDVSHFRVLRSGPADDEAALIAEVPGRSGYGPRRYDHSDTPELPGTYAYRINPVGPDGEEHEGPSVSVHMGAAPGLKLALRNVRPNPMVLGNAATVFFAVPGNGSRDLATSLRVLDLQGRVVRTLVQEPLAAGLHTRTWDGRDNGDRRLPSGLYLLVLEAGGNSAHHRLLLMR
jgi:hypothetical protein